MKHTLNLYDRLGEKTVEKCICASCGKKLNYFSFTVEHMIPRLHDGSNSKINLCLLCRNCNQNKGDKICLNVHKAYPYLRDEYKRQYQVMMVAFMDMFNGG